MYAHAHTHSLTHSLTVKVQSSWLNSALLVGTVEVPLPKHCSVVYSGDGVKVKEEEEQTQTWETGKHYCDGIHAQSRWLSVVAVMAHVLCPTGWLALLWLHMYTIKLADRCIDVVSHMHRPAGWLLHYCCGTCACSSWLSVALYHYWYWYPHELKCGHKACRARR